MDYHVTYQTPAARGIAVVQADGIVASQAEARLAVHILTGHPEDAVALLQVADAAGRVLWTSTNEEQCNVGAD